MEAQKIGFSELRRFNASSLGNGLMTPGIRAGRLLEEFFNRIGRVLPSPIDQVNVAFGRTAGLGAIFSTDSSSAFAAVAPVRHKRLVYISHWLLPAKLSLMAAFHYDECALPTRTGQSGFLEADVQRPPLTCEG